MANVNHQIKISITKEIDDSVDKILERNPCPKSDFNRYIYLTGLKLFKSKIAEGYDAIYLPMDNSTPKLKTIEFEEENRR